MSVDVIHSYTKNPELTTVDLPFDWPGTPLDRRGRFVNHEIPFLNSMRELLKWQTMTNPQKEEKKNETWRLDVQMNDAFIESNEDCIVWLGHASFFVRLNGITLLIDPVLFDVSLLKRRAALPVQPSRLERIDYILISHDHRDHCDTRSLSLLAKNNPEATYLTGLKLDRFLTKATGSGRIQAAGWYQQYVTDERIRVIYVPSRHWSRRLLNDTNQNLWGGYIIQGAGKTIYFSGDSGYGSHFTDIGKAFPNIDYCMIGIGAYKPEFFMAQSHVSPADAVRAFENTGANKMIPMHYGTFDLSDEPLGDPERVLKKIEQEKSLSGKVRYLKPGKVEHL